MSILTEPDELPKLKNDKEFSIYTANSRFSKKWRHQTTTISEFVSRISTPTPTQETFNEYLNMTKDEQDAIKDVGSFIGGILRGATRKKEDVVNRSILTFDMDYCEPDVVSIIKDKLKNIAYSYYSTHKHSDAKPRLRLIVYPDRPLYVDEYQPVCRKVAEYVGIEMFDASTYQLNRLFYWPSVSKGAPFVWGHNDRVFLNVNKTLSRYGENDAWKDAGRWKYSSRETMQVDRAIKKQADPLLKKGIVGSFCRNISIYDALDNYLSNIYRKENDCRYTYLEGTTSNGLVVYSDKYVYSNHSTDPAHARCLNAFDLIRIHKFGHLDKDSSVIESTTKLDSYKAMVEFAQAIEAVSIDMVKSGFVTPESFDAFADDAPEEPDSKNEDAWMTLLQKSVTSTGVSTVKPTWFNLVLIMKNDKRINMKMKFNEFSNRVEKETGEDLTKQELFQMRTFVGGQYRINIAINDIKQAVETQAFENKYHPIRDYIKSLVWDGTPRIETVFQDYVGSIDNKYVREVSKCWFAAAVYRVFEPGFKFDTVIVLSGPQGIGKTRFIEALGLKKWYGELSSFDPKIAMEELSGKWIVELPEMGVVSKHELEQQKSFLSARYTRVRLAYEPIPVDYKRQCVFMGTTNEQEYLKDSTGNRRWWPIDCSDIKFDIEKLKNNIGQIWAEAYQLYLQRQKVWLEDEVLSVAKQVQEDKRESDPWEGLIGEWLEEECPVERIRYEQDYSSESFFDNQDVEMEIRKKVCVLEIWKDCLGNRYESTPKDRRRIGHIMNNMNYYEKDGVARFGKRFGSQKAWRRSLPF